MKITADKHFTSANDVRLMARADYIRGIIVDLFNDRAPIHENTVNHYAGLIRTIEARGIDGGFHRTWLAAFLPELSRFVRARVAVC